MAEGQCELYKDQCRPSPVLFFVVYMVWLMTLPMVSAASRFIPSVAWV